MPMLTRSKEAHVFHSAAGLAVDEATRPDLIEFGAKNLRDENVRQTVRGALTKRNGFAVLSNTRIDASTATAGYKLFEDNNNIVRITDTLQAEAYSPKLSEWVPMGRVPEVGVRTTGLPVNMVAANLGVQDIEYVNGYLAVLTDASTATASDGAFTVLDEANLGSLTLAGTGYPRTYMASYGSRYLALFSDGTNHIDIRWFDTSTFPFTATGASSVAADWNGGDFAVCGLSDRVVLAYSNTSAGTNKLTVKTFNFAGFATAVDSTTVNTSSVKPGAVDVRAFSGGTLWVAWNEAATVKMVGLTGTSLGTVLATTGTIIAASTDVNLISISPDSTTTGRLFVNSTIMINSTFAHTNGFRTTAGVATAIGGTTTLHNVVHCSRPCFYNGRHYVMAFGGGTATAMTGDAQKVAILVDWTDPGLQYLRPVANIAPSLAVPSLRGKTKIIAGSTSSTFYTGIGVTRSSAAAAATLVSFDFADTRRWQPATYAGSTYLSGGLLTCFDGTRVAEVGFLVRPKQPLAVVSGTGITGNFRYVAVYEEVDADGNWHVSGLSDPSASIVAANQTVTVTVCPLTITQRVTSAVTAPNVRVVLYRTATGSVAPYYRLASLTNDVTVDGMTYTDVTTDAVLTVNAQLYSQPGIPGTSQDRRPPPGLNIVTVYNGMLVGASGSDVWFSGQNVSGEGTWFNPIFQVPVPGEGDITALAVLDGTLLAFKRREVYALAGDPPSDNGASGGLGAPRRLASDVGCIDPRTTCLTAFGLFFQSDRGIEILTRAQTVEPIGVDFQTTAGAFPKCTSITVEPVSNTVLVELAASESGGIITGLGCTLVYDLNLKSWVSKDLRKDTTQTIGTAAQSACMIYTGTVWRYAWLAASGVVYYETPGTSLDAGAYWITSLYETADAKHGLQQEQRIWGGVLLFEHADAAGLKIEVSYDRAAYSSGNDKVWTEAETLSGLRQLEYRPKSRGQAMRFRVSDTAPAVLGTGHGLTFIGMSLDAAAKQGPTTGTPHLDPSLRK